MKTKIEGLEMALQEKISDAEKEVMKKELVEVRAQLNSAKEINENSLLIKSEFRDANDELQQYAEEKVVQYEASNKRANEAESQLQELQKDM